MRYLKVQSAIHHADRMAKLTGKRHYVIQVFNRIRVYDRLHINLLIARGVLHPRLKDSIELTKVCIYYTGKKNNNAK